jgi:hypothetical protein
MKHAPHFAAAILLMNACTPAPPPPEKSAETATAAAPPAPDAPRDDSPEGLRREGWALLAKVVAPAPGSDLPLWRTWPQTNEVLFHQQPGFADKTPLLRPPGEYEGAPPEPPSTARDLYESTHYNPDASAHIQKVLETEQSDVLLANSRREITEFPPSAIIVKAFWRKARPGVQEPLGVWNRSRPQTKGLNDSREVNWEQQTCFTLQPAEPCLTVDNHNFHFVTVDDPSHFSCPNCKSPQVNPGDVMVLVALHVVAKTRPDWFWSTFWWKGERFRHQSAASWSCDNAQRPPEIASMPPWNNYSMDVTVSFNRRKPQLPANDPCGAPGRIGDRLELLAAFNPYVEARLTNGLISTCVDCHSRARTEDDVAPNLVPSPDREDRDPKLPDFEGHIRTDYVWSLRHALKRTH